MTDIVLFGRPGCGLCLLAKGRAKQVCAGRADLRFSYHDLETEAGMVESAVCDVSLSVLPVLQIRRAGELVAQWLGEPPTTDALQAEIGE